MKNRNGSTHSHRRRSPWRLLGFTVLTGVALTSAAYAAGTPVKPTSSCVACHTDAEQLKAEAATIPVPSASALQAGKG